MAIIQASAVLRHVMNKLIKYSYMYRSEIKYFYLLALDTHSI
jgi:hypothetical protein